MATDRLAHSILAITLVLQDEVNYNRLRWHGLIVEYAFLPNSWMIVVKQCKNCKNIQMKNLFPISAFEWWNSAISECHCTVWVSQSAKRWGRHTVSKLPIQQIRDQVTTITSLHSDTNTGPWRLISPHPWTKLSKVMLIYLISQIK